MAYIEGLDSEDRRRIESAQERRAVDLNSLARGLGIRIITESSVEGDGYIEYNRDLRGGCFTVHVNSTHSPNRQRFTIAHEMAHYLLHRNDIMQEESMDRGIRSGFEDYREAQANQLAAEILMPIKNIKEAVGEGYTTIEILAPNLLVSEKSLRIRLDM